MSARRQLLWFAVGFLAATALAWAGLPSPAHAQQPARLKPSLRDTPEPVEKPKRKVDPAQEVFDSNAATGIPGAIPKSDPTAEAEEADGLEPGLATGQRGAVVDGDAGEPAEAAALRDGILDDVEPQQVVDGIDPTQVDTRDETDREAFDDVLPFGKPPEEEINPLLYQTEDVEPLADRRIQRLSTLDPFDPVGIRVGSFVLFPEVESSTVWRSNVFSSPVARSDLAFEFEPVARLVSDWNRHALEFSASGLLSAYTEFDSENDTNYRLETRARLDLAKRTNVQAVASHDVYEESRSAIDASTAGDRAQVRTNKLNTTLNHRFNRLSLQLRGGISDLDYGSQQSGTTLITNDDRDRQEYEETLRATWEFKPTFSVFAEAGVNQRRYDTPAASDLRLRTSDGERYRAGVDFGRTGAYLRGEASVGYGRQDPSAAGLQTVEGLFVDANVTWRMTELTSLLVTARTDIYDTTTADVAGVLQHDVGLELRHALRRYVIASAGIAVSLRDYPGAPIEEHEVRTTLGLEYYLNRDAVISAGYVHTAFSSNQPDANYDSDVIRLGVKLRR